MLTLQWALIYFDYLLGRFYELKSKNNRIPKTA